MKIRDESGVAQRVQLGEMVEGEPFELRGNYYMRAGRAGHDTCLKLRVIEIESGTAEPLWFYPEELVAPLECELVVTGVRQ